MINGGEFTFGSVVTFTCNDSFSLSGQGTVTCGEDGWDKAAPICQRQYFKLLISPNTYILCPVNVSHMENSLILSLEGLDI